jgi:hypothetical protein
VLPLPRLLVPLLVLPRPPVVLLLWAVLLVPLLVPPPVLPEPPSVLKCLKLIIKDN